MTQQQERVHPTIEQALKAHELLSQVPAAGYDWQSPRGLDFLAYAAALVKDDVPVEWLAQRLDLTPSQLGMALYRYRLEVRGRIA